MNQILKLNDLPFPITVNESLASVKGRLIKTKKAREYLHSMEIWTKKNQWFIDQCKVIIKKWMISKTPLRVDTFLAWPESEVLVDTKNKTAIHWAQQKDGTNRIKQLHDALSEILEIDDRYFFYSDCSKIISDNDQKKCMVTIQPTKILKMNDIENYLKSLDVVNDNEIDKIINKSEGYKIYEQ